MKFKLRFTKHSYNIKHEHGLFFTYNVSSGFCFVSNNNKSWFFEVQLFGVSFSITKE